MKGILAIVLLFQLLTVETLAQSSGEPLPPGYYIVVAAYRLGQDTYATNYIKGINNTEISAKYGADLGRKYLYVYLDYYDDFDTSIKEMLATRKKGGFEKAWVRIMKDPLATTIAPEAAEKKEDATNQQELSDSSTQNENGPTNEQKEEELIEAAVVETTVMSPEEGTADEVIEVIEVIEEEEKNIEDNPITEPVDLAEASVFLSLYNSTTDEQVEGEIEVIDTERSRLIEKMKGNEYVKLPDPKSKSGKLTLLANVFGYRPLQHDMDYTHTAADTLQPFIEWAGNHYMVHFDLVRYHKGDINTLFNVYFYNDAAIMLPESRYQLNSLLAMMKENMHYRIRLHGHTNGNARGTILTMGPSQEFFSLADDIKKTTGSAKELSNQRAKVIKDWLVSQGITEDRVEVKAWGGGRMLHDQHSVNAKKNVRVDVEILSE
jgi:outer membrane protein OmpA-like peptidoglycan-associated protein